MPSESRTPQLVEALKAASLADVEARLKELHAEEDALTVIARSLRARERATTKGCPQAKAGQR